MNVRTRGLLILAGSLVAGAGVYWLIFNVFANASHTTRVAAYPLALPLVGMAVGSLELATGVPIQRLDEGWQKIPGYVRIPVAIVGSLAFLIGLVKLLGF
jgi:hypothetical protein